VGADDPSPEAISAGDLPRVLVVGPDPGAHGGVAAMVGAIVSSDGLRTRFRLGLVTTVGHEQRIGKGLHAMRGLARLALEVARRRVDVVDVHSSTGGSLARKVAALTIARLGRVPVVFHLHAGGAAALLDGERGGIQARLLRHALRTADCVVSLTPGWDDRVRRAVPVRRSRVVGNVPSLPAPVTRREPDRTIVCLGHLYRRKGVHDLLDAFALLRHDDPELVLVLAGEGPEAAPLAARVAADPLLRGAVELPGWIGPDAKAQLLSRAGCLVIPSHDEGLPLSLLEAMVSGVPVVATRVGGIPEAVRDGVDGLLVPPADVPALAAAIASILGDGKLRDALTASAAERARERYSAESLAREMAEVFHEVLAS
jgi:glycosyltransferase involved in cell wall biosynthesis